MTSLNARFLGSTICRMRYWLLVTDVQNCDSMLPITFLFNEGARVRVCFVLCALTFLSVGLSTLYLIVVRVLLSASSTYTSLVEGSLNNVSHPTMYDPASHQERMQAYLETRKVGRLPRCTFQMYKGLYLHLQKCLWRKAPSKTPLVQTVFVLVAYYSVLKHNFWTNYRQML